MFNISSPDIKNLESDLKTFKERALPFATRNTLDVTAFRGHKNAQANVTTQMILRNKFTLKSIQFEKVGRELIISRQMSKVGSTQEYMADQEFGAMRLLKGKRGVPIATTAASGEGEGARPRRKLPSRFNKLSNIHLGKGAPRGFKSKKQAIFVKTLMAARAGKKHLYLDNGGKQAIYRIQGRGRLDKRGRIVGIRMRMVWDLSHKSVTIPRTKWLEPAVNETRKEIPEIYRKSLEFQLKKHGLFKD